MPLLPPDPGDDFAPLSASEALLADERHAGDVGAVERALRSAGYEAEALGLEASPEGDRRTRLTFGSGSTGGVGHLVVLTRARGHSSVTSPSLPGVYTLSLPALADLLAEVDPSSVTTDGATNEEVLRLHHLRDSLPSATRSALSYTDGPSSDPEITWVLSYPEVADRTDVLEATAFLEGVASGTPVEWALRARRRAPR